MVFIPLAYQIFHIVRGKIAITGKAKRSVILILMLFSVLLPVARAQELPLKIALFYDSPVQTVIFSPEEGNYYLNRGEVHETIIEQNEIIYISLLGDSLSVRGLNTFHGYFKKIGFEPVEAEGKFSLRPVLPLSNKRNYHGSLDIAAEFMRIMMINRVDMNHYLAGVVLSEAGGGATLEFYKAQAVLCRTYTMDNLHRHAGEGSNLCDGVHCQAYKQYNGISGIIDQAVKETSGEVAVYNDTILITAAFHSNCGGQTQNADREWLMHEPWFREVLDPYCKKGRNSTWEKTISLEKWKEYLLANGFTQSNVSNSANLVCENKERTDYYQIGSSKISYKKIRTDWFLKSSFFSVMIRSDNNVLLKGRGYGHGIGMCQEGGMNMGKSGFNYRQILNFYFTGIDVINYQVIEKYH